MLYCQQSESNTSLSSEDLRTGLRRALESLGVRRNVLAIPPDITRLHSRAGELTCCAHDYYGKALTSILPALGTHAAMTPDEINRMFPGIPHEIFREHRWRTDLAALGTVPASFLAQVSGGKVSYDWPVQVNKLLVEGGFDLILSLGQVAPHEVTGMANHAKNIFVGTGGAGAIHKSHYLGALYGMERIMGRTDSPVRAVLDYAVREFAGELPILYVLTVIGPVERGGMGVRGLFIGTGRECFEKAAVLSRKVNFTMVERPIDKCVVYLNPDEFRSTWLGNKAIYRTRMAMADGGELMVMGPGVKRFGEDEEIDRLIRRYGYCGPSAVLDSVRRNADLRANLAAAAHLIHGSPGDRFRVTYAPGYLSREEILGVGYAFADTAELAARYNPSELKAGWNRVDGQDVYFVANPALGLWAHPGSYSRNNNGN